MKPRTLLTAAAVLLAAFALPLRAQDAAPGGVLPASAPAGDSVRPVHIAPVVINEIVAHGHHAQKNVALGLKLFAPHQLMHATLC